MAIVSTFLQQVDEKFLFVEFKLQSASDEEEAISVKEGLVSEKFNIAEKCLPEEFPRRSHTNLGDFEIPEVELTKVTVLTGKGLVRHMKCLKFERQTSLIARCNLYGAHWVGS